MLTETMGLGRVAFLAGAIALAAGAASATPAFHPAQSPAEQALARILKLDENPPGAVDPVGAEGASGRRPRTTPPPGAPYLKHLTTPLATAILAQEARAVKASCGGVYKSGELCGLDADPIICAQDFPDSYLFRTVQSGPSLAVVEAAWPPDSGAQTTRSGSYRLALSGGVWKIDGIACAAGDRYNWPGR